VSEQRPLRVLHIGKYLPPVPGGIETYLGDLLRVSMRHGLKVGAVVHGKKGYPDPNPADFGGAKIYAVPTYGQVLYAPVAPMFPWALRKAIREFKPDVLHMHVPNTSAFWALFIPEARKIPWVLHWHADVEFPEQSLWVRTALAGYQFFERRLLRSVRMVITTSDDYLDGSSALSSYRAKCRSIPLGLDLKRLDSAGIRKLGHLNRYWKKPSEPRFLAVGRLVPYKGFNFLIEAMAKISRGSLLIIGDGPERDSLIATTRRLNLESRIDIFSTVEEERVLAFIASCDVLCLPSIDRREAFGLVLLEASAFGKSIVASAIDGSGVTWAAAQCGRAVMTPPGDADQLAAALVYAHGSSSTFDFSGLPNLSPVLCIDNTMQNISAVYNELTNSVEESSFSAERVGSDRDG
jgi:glycosyltransferase involved in cell wall biosynthesis